MSASLTAIGNYPTEPTVVTIIENEMKTHIHINCIVGNPYSLLTLVMSFCATNNLLYALTIPIVIAKSSEYPKDLLIEISKYLVKNNIRIQPPDGDVWGLTA